MARTMPGTDTALSAVQVPIIGSDRVLGVIIVENYERENAFGESDVRLLTTVAASMGVALENARLFDETQRLLKETEQRNAELAVINSIQQGMAAELDFQAIVDLVGDKLREVLAGPATSASAGTTRDPTWSITSTSTSTASGCTCRRRCRRRAGLGRTNARDAARRSSSTRAPSSRRRARGTGPGHRHRALGRLRADRRPATGCSARSLLENHEREHAFGESEVRLLTTRRRQHGRGARERAPLRRDAAPAQGDRAARRRARGHQQHPGGHGGRARLPGDRRPGRRQAARGASHRRHRHSLARPRRRICIHYLYSVRARRAAARRPMPRARAGRPVRQLVRRAQPLVVNNPRRASRPRDSTVMPGTDAEPLVTSLSRSWAATASSA